MLDFILKWNGAIASFSINCVVLILRNIEMASYADALIYFWDGESTGTAHMIGEAKKRNLLIRGKIYG